MAIEGSFDRDIRGQSAARFGDAAVAGLAARQHGVVGRGQLLAAGLSNDAIDRRIRLSRLHPLHRGVYAVGHPLVSLPGIWMAAVLAAGPEAVLSHHAAAALWRIRDPRDSKPEVIVRRRVDRPRIAARRIALQDDEVTIERGIPVTTPARTLFDLAHALTQQQLEAAITEAEINRLGSPTSLADLVARYPGRRGIATLRSILEHHDRIGRTVTRSDLEVAFLAFLDAHGLPRPKTNAAIELEDGRQPMVDAVWPERRLVAELDSYGIHTTRRNFEEDRARDRALTAHGWRVVRITWRQLHDRDRTALAAELAALLG
jgi:hypothetical protein